MGCIGTAEKGTLLPSDAAHAHNLEAYNDLLPIPVAAVVPASSGMITPNCIRLISRAGGLKLLQCLPVIHLDSSEAKNLTAAATSQAVPSV